MPLTRRKFVTTLGVGILASGFAQGQNQGESKKKENSASGNIATAKPGSGRPKVLVVAVDALDPKMTGHFLRDMPALNRIVTEGYSGSILPYASTWGNLNFMSMFTGTAPGTHNRSEYPDGSSPITPKCTAEPIWQTLGSENRRSLLVTFPQGSPSGSEFAATVSCGGYSGTYLFGGAVHQTKNITDGYVDRSGHEKSGWPPGGGPRVGRLSRFIDDPKTARSGLRGIQSNQPPLEVILSLSDNSANEWLAVITAQGLKKFTSVTLYSNPKHRPVANLKVGEWSEWIPGNFQANGSRVKGRIRFKLLSLNADGRGFQLLQSACCPEQGVSEPEEFGALLLEQLGSYSAISSIGMYPHDPYWREGVAESLHREMWIARAAELGLQEWGWDLFLTKMSLIDSAKHQCSMPVDPDYYRYEPEDAKLYEEVLREAHKAGDQVFAKYLEICERNGITLIIAGDHGMGLNNVICDIERLLEKVGLLHRSSNGEIDWKRTSAFIKRTRQGSEVFVNLKGREPHGSVSPESYIGVQEKIIDALIDWRDPETGKRAVSYALKHRDALVLGYHGSVFGDVVFAYNPGFSWGIPPNGTDIYPSFATGTNHGAQIPSAETGLNSNLGVLYAWGPGIKPGRRDEEMMGPIPIDAIAPSLSHLLECPLPKDATAAAVRDMLV